MQHLQKSTKLANWTSDISMSLWTLIMCLVMHIVCFVSNIKKNSCIVVHAMDSMPNMVELWNDEEFSSLQLQA